MPWGWCQFTDARKHRHPGGYINSSECPGVGAPCFRPYDDGTRNDFVRAVVLSEGWPWLADPPTPTFGDVPLDGYMSKIIETSYRKGVISGYDGDPNYLNMCLNPPNGQYEVSGVRYFRGCNTILRSQAAKVLTLAEGWPTVIIPGTGTFADVPSNAFFFGVVETVANYGLVSGYSCGGQGEPCDAQNRPYYS